MLLYVFTEFMPKFTISAVLNWTNMRFQIALTGTTKMKHSWSVELRKSKTLSKPVGIPFCAQP